MAFASPSDCMMSLEQFQELGEYLGFALSYNCAKSLFEQKLRDWESYAFTLEDFQDACIVAQLDRMRARLKSHRQNMLACAFHIDSFIRHLSLYSGEVQRRRAVGRFQQKITTKFCVPRGRREQRSAARSARGVELDGERSNTNGVPFTTFSFSSCGGEASLAYSGSRSRPNF
ncbi:unnamed protein product [Durusdinium trenchii]|uniref:Uncharacterized protein n=1 Tax=Durusdinium trenchii TaxID=1381693 RepID=A0ABP0RKL1_9DINO